MKWGIKHHIWLLAVGPTLTLSFLFGMGGTTLQLKEMKSTFRQQGQAMALSLAAQTAEALSTQNHSLLQHLGSHFLHQHTALSVTFYTEHSEKLFALGHPHFHSFNLPAKQFSNSPVYLQEDKHCVAFLTPILKIKEVATLDPALKFSPTLVGWLKLELDTQPQKAAQSRLLTRIGLLCFLSLGISALFAFPIHRRILSALSILTAALKNLQKGNFHPPLALPYPELETVETGINALAQTLYAAHSELQHKIDQATLSLRRTLETIEVQNIELEIARRAAENANKVKSEFLADMSHEIRNPLNGVIGFINLLQKTELSAKQEEYLSTIQKSAGNLLTIINDILDFSKIEAGKLRIEQTPVDIRDCIDETLNLLAPHAHEKNIALIPLVYSDVPPIVMGDPLRIKQIITNLVSNSIKFTDQGSIIIRVLVESESLSHLVIRASVTDTGIGISAEEQKLLFQAFNQTKIDTSRKFGGTGLGLIICKKLVEQMGGTIGVESEPLKGATFWFTFQVDKYTGEALPERLPLEDKKASALASIATHHASLSVLAVDDNPENLKLITVLLEEMGFQVQVAASGEQALEFVNTRSFDLIFMDIRMPKMSGIEASHLIRELETEKNQSPTPIVALTAHALESERKALLAAGIDDYLSKPIGEMELKTILAKWIYKPDSTPIFDFELSKKLAAGRADLAQEFFEKLIESLPKDQQIIQEDYENKDWNALRDHIHKLHGACCYCGVPQLKECARALEDAAVTRTTTIIKPALDAFNKAIQELLLKAPTIHFP